MADASTVRVRLALAPTTVVAVVRAAAVRMRIEETEDVTLGDTKHNASM